MPETSDRLVAAALNGQGIPFAHGVLIHALQGWHVALYEVPTYACPAVSGNGQLVVQTVGGKRMTGYAVTELVTQGGGFVLLSGLGRLRAKLPAQAA
jgi:hypothetical protein